MDDDMPESEWAAGMGAFEDMALEDSIWDAAMLIGMEPVGLAASWFLAFLFVANAFAQGVFLVIIATSNLSKRVGGEALEPTAPCGVVAFHRTNRIMLPHPLCACHTLRSARARPRACRRTARRPWSRRDSGGECRRITFNTTTVRP